MTHHLLVNGVPHCQSPLTYETGTSCAHSTKSEAEKAAFKILQAHPTAKVTIIDGSCPVREYDPYFEGRQDAKEWAVRGMAELKGKSPEWDAAIDACMEWVRSA